MESGEDEGIWRGEDDLGWLGPEWVALLRAMRLTHSVTEGVKGPPAGGNGFTGGEGLPASVSVNAESTAMQQQQQQQQQQHQQHQQQHQQQQHQHQQQQHQQQQQQEGEMEWGGETCFQQFPAVNGSGSSSSSGGSLTPSAAHRSFFDADDSHSYQDSTASGGGAAQSELAVGRPCSHTHLHPSPPPPPPPPLGTQPPSTIHPFTGLVIAQRRATVVDLAHTASAPPSNRPPPSRPTPSSPTPTSSPLQDPAPAPSPPPPLHRPDHHAHVLPLPPAQSRPTPPSLSDPHTPSHPNLTPTPTPTPTPTLPATQPLLLPQRWAAQHSAAPSSEGDEGATLATMPLIPPAVDYLVSELHLLFEVSAKQAWLAV